MKIVDKFTNIYIAHIVKLRYSLGRLCRKRERERSYKFCEREDVRTHLTSKTKQKIALPKQSRKCNISKNVMKINVL